VLAVRVDLGERGEQASVVSVVAAASSASVARSEMTHGSCGGSPAHHSHQPTHASAMNRLAHTEAASPKVNEELFEPSPTSTRSMSWVWPTARSWSSCAATVRPFSRFAEGFAMSCGWPPEQARLNRSWMPARSACRSEDRDERWQKNALAFGASQPGNPCATPSMSATGW
jgi:hypothetical protein